MQSQPSITITSIGIRNHLLGLRDRLFFTALIRSRGNYVTSSEREKKTGLPFLFRVFFFHETLDIVLKSAKLGERLHFRVSCVIARGHANNFQNEYLNLSLESFYF